MCVCVCMFERERDLILRNDDVCLENVRIWYARWGKWGYHLEIAHMNDENKTFLFLITNLFFFELSSDNKNK